MGKLRVAGPLRLLVLPACVPASPPALSHAHLLQVVSQEVQLILAVHGGQLSAEPRTDALGLDPRRVVLEELVLGLLEAQPFPPACRGNASVGVVARLELPARPWRTRWVQGRARAGEPVSPADPDQWS